MKEYGPHSHVAANIIKESIKILILTSLISSIGGISLNNVQAKLLTILPLIILLPAMNNMIGSMGTIVSSKFTTMLYLKKVSVKWWTSPELHKLFFTVLAVAMISSVYISILATGISVYSGYALSSTIALDVLFFSLVSTFIIVILIFFISVTGGIFIYKRKEDPNNFLIPIATSVADLGSMLIFVFLVGLLF